MFETGYLQVAKLGGAPVRIHWSVAVGAVMFVGLRFAPAAWLAFALLVLVHELGHAAAVLFFRLEVVSVDVHGFGGVILAGARAYYAMAKDGLFLARAGELNRASVPGWSPAVRVRRRPVSVPPNGSKHSQAHRLSPGC